MATLPNFILLHAMSLPEGGVLSPKEFLHRGSRAAVDQAFTRLTKVGKLLRVARGTYVMPVASRFGTRAPSPKKVVHALAAQHGELVSPHGANAANALGLTQQVPVREVYLTSGRTRHLKLGRSEVMVKHAPHWMLALGPGPAGSAVRALAWMGPSHVSESLRTLHRTLPPSEWHALTAVLGYTAVISVRLRIHAQRDLFGTQRIQLDPVHQDDPHACEGVVVELANGLADHVFPAHALAVQRHTLVLKQVDVHRVLR